MAEQTIGEAAGVGTRDHGADDAEGVLGFVSDVPLELTVEVGHTRLLVREVLQLSKGAVVELDRMAGEPADVLVNGRLVARGEITVVDDRLSVRLVEVHGGREGRR
ncbi:MAG TPA: flagellar motor switch protein FliN [Myxococcota bacterium]|jgi:flagellar motor switch protein FliN/FliY|nr:flagellar motor switch protein FliN [Myxococcota bacterium]